MTDHGVLMGEWGQWMRDRGMASDTIEHYGRTIGRYLATTDDPIAASGDDITRWLAQFTGRKPNTRRAYRSAIGSLYRHLLWVGAITVDPMQRVPTVRVPKGAPRPITGDQLARAMATANPRMQRWLLLAADAGLRRAEIAMLSPDDVIGRRLHITGKGKRQRIVPVSQRLAASLDTWQPETASRMWLAGPDRVGDLMSLHLHSCGVNATAHMLRHYFASRYYAASGCDLRATQAVMGHSSVATTEVYVSLAEDDGIIDRMAS